MNSHALLLHLSFLELEADPVLHHSVRIELSDAKRHALLLLLHEALLLLDRLEGDCRLSVDEGSLVGHFSLRVVFGTFAIALNVQKTDHLVVSFVLLDAILVVLDHLVADEFANDILLGVVLHPALLLQLAVLVEEAATLLEGAFLVVLRDAFQLATLHRVLVVEPLHRRVLLQQGDPLSVLVEPVEHFVSLVIVLVTLSFLMTILHRPAKDDVVIIVSENTIAVELIIDEMEVCNDHVVLIHKSRISFLLPIHTANDQLEFLPIPGVIQGRLSLHHSSRLGRIVNKIGKKRSIRHRLHQM